ncbi:expressed unknown protein [Seminavis robusta]|uniref:Uncharacterized protein n=1 Tax=Seminavis robusta TaxID=568900 RepID=A0A9N8HDZ3_9STRA|nr:expressed unknown protein [Seminavis robusta]|eukprot:Sro487_g152770.1 n/a (299) ;mRNA; f:11767-12663
MKIQMSLPVFILAAAGTPSSVSAIKGAKDNKAAAEGNFEIQPRRLRALKSTQGQGSVARDGLIEIKPCVPWSSVSSAQTTNPQTDSACVSNPPSTGGCCRDYHWLLWDATNSYPYVPCICNDITQDPNSFVPSTLPPFSSNPGPSNNGPGHRRKLEKPTPNGNDDVEKDENKRELKKGPSARNGNIESEGLKEIRPCVPWSSITEAQKTNAESDSVCATNDPSTKTGGCCRAFVYLLWDDNNSYPNVDCICNDITQDPSNFMSDTNPPIDISGTVSDPIYTGQDHGKMRRGLASSASN